MNIFRTVAEIIYKGQPISLLVDAEHEEGRLTTLRIHEISQDEGQVIGPSLPLCKVPNISQIKQKVEFAIAALV